MTRPAQRPSLCKATSSVVLLCLPWLLTPLSAQWQPAEAPLDTPWTAKVDPANPLPEHPRPDFQRESWMSLNGLWDYGLEPVEFKPMQGFIDRPSMTTGTPPATWAGKILVPFAIDSPLSGIMHVLRPQERLWYHRTFELPTGWKDQRVLLHIEASDWETSVYLNGRRLGQHRGGYDPFQLDLTDGLKDGANTLHVCVWDGTEQHCQPLGKQIMPENRKGFRYQPTGGIWQTVWLEAVPEVRLASLKVTASHTGDVEIQAPVASSNPSKVKGSVSVTAIVKDGDTTVHRSVVTAGHPIKFTLPNPKPWSPDSPHLYDLTLRVQENGVEAVDTVTSYLGLRTIEVRHFGQIHLNGKLAPIQWGPLDQGYWPDGILTPPHEDAIKFDLEYLKSIGCNMARVHIKVHPRRWYYHADRLGLLVWQDMVCTPKYGQTVDKAGSENWLREFRELISDFHNHPSIVKWVVFNEAWGQHETGRFTRWAAEADPSRLILGASGWTDHGTGDLLDVHNYAFYPTAPSADGFGNSRALVFGELGGHNLLLPGKKWYPDQKQKLGPSLERAGGRMNFNSTEDLAAKYPFYIRNIRHFATRLGYQAFVYTQITDIEHECNGWLTYDRRISKLPAATFREIHDSLAKSADYTLLAGKDQWRAGRVGIAKKGPDPEPWPWTAPGAKIPNFNPITLPHAGGPIAPARKKAKALGLRQQFTIKSKPERAVLELRATHRDAHGAPPPDLLDGHQGRARAAVPILTYLDGKLHRRGTMSVERGQGEAVLFLELTDPERASLTPGEHTLAIELSAPESVVGFDAKLWSYRE